MAKKDDLLNQLKGRADATATAISMGSALIKMREERQRKKIEEEDKRKAAVSDSTQNAMRRQTLKIDRDYPLSPTPSIKTNKK